MGDAALAERIAEAGGLALVGFRDSGSVAGVTESGHTLASARAIERAKADLRSLGVTIETEYRFVPAVAAHIAAAMLPEVRRNPRVEYIEPSAPVTELSQDTTWNMRHIGAPAAWSYSAGSGATLLIIDTGIDTSHSDLDPLSYGPCENARDGVDTEGHGTAVAGVAAAVDNSIGVIGAAYGVSLLTCEHSGNASSIAAGVDLGIQAGVDVINLSIGMSPSTTVSDAINCAYNEHGILIVAAAGNDGPGTIAYPAILAVALAVSATDSFDMITSFSGTQEKIELAAPGQSVRTTQLGGGYSVWYGTSFAAPHVAAAAALLKAYNSSWTNDEIRDRLANTARDFCPAGHDSIYGSGFLNIPAAMGVTSTLYVDCVGGPQSVGYSDTYEWSTRPSGGTGTFAYQWAYENAGSSTWHSLGTGDWATRYVATDSADFKIRVIVVSGSDTVADSISVEVNPITSIDLSGPTDVHGGQVCHWTATPTGGSAPYIYDWMTGSVVDTTGDPDTYGAYVLEHFWLRVTITAANGSQDSTKEEIFVDEGNPGC